MVKTNLIPTDKDFKKAGDILNLSKSLKLSISKIVFGMNKTKYIYTNLYNEYNLYIKKFNSKIILIICKFSILYNFKDIQIKEYCIKMINIYYYIITKYNINYHQQEYIIDYFNNKILINLSSQEIISNIHNYLVLYYENDNLDPLMLQIPESYQNEMIIEPKYIKFQQLFSS